MADFHIHDSMTREKRAFVPIDAGNVRIYVCGPTVYDLAHLGNARSAVVFDQLRRVLAASYRQVTFVRNVTDIDDKIIERAARLAQPISVLTARTHQAYLEDMGALAVLPPTAEPRATAYIPQMQAMIARLIGLGHAYEAQGHVLFAVASAQAAGRLSGHQDDALRAGASGRVEHASYKREQADFVLWKPSDPAQPGWDSPWGRGRPGWHVECSAMAAAHLGPVFDIHGGGHDLVFPHHEAEIAQSTCAHGTHELARYWMHNGMLTVDGAKMSKSAGNFVTVRQLLERHPGRGEAVRLLLLSSHYRQPLDFTHARLAEAIQQLDRFYGALRHAGTPRHDGAAVPADSRVTEALHDDLNTPLALARLHALATEALAAPQGPERHQAAATLQASGRLMGLLDSAPDAWFHATGDGVTADATHAIEAMVAARSQARQARDFREADRIRALLLQDGVVVEDGVAGTSWKRLAI